MGVLKLLPRGINEVFRDHVARRDAAAVPTEPQQNNQFQRHSAGYPGAQNSCHDQPARRRNSGGRLQWECNGCYRPLLPSLAGEMTAQLPGQKVYQL